METDDLSWLLSVAKSGSLSAAAKARGVAVSTVARRLDSVEARLKLRLIDRRRDGVRLTTDGERIALQAQCVVEQVDALERLAAARRDGERRPIIITATEMVIADILGPNLHLLFADAPEMRIDLRSEASVVSLAGREADLAIRMSPPQGASLIAKRLTGFKMGFYASIAYVAGRDPLAILLSDERVLAYNDSFGRLPELDALSDGGQFIEIAVATNSTRALLNAAVAGAGVALLPRVFAAAAGLVEIAGPSLPARAPFLVTHRDLRRQPDVRTVHRWITRAFETLRHR